MAKPSSPHAARSAGRGWPGFWPDCRPARPDRRWPPWPPAIARASQLYESFTLIKLLESNAAGPPETRTAARPARTTCSAIRETMIFSFCGHQRQAVVVGKIGISLVDQQRAGQPLGQFQNPLGLKHRARGAVGIRQKRQLQIARGAAELVAAATSRRSKGTSSRAAPCNWASVL